MAVKHTFDKMCRQHEVLHEINGCKACPPELGGLSPHPWIWIDCDTPAACEAEKLRRFQEMQKELA